LTLWLNVTGSNLTPLLTQVPNSCGDFFVFKKYTIDLKKN
jgi:hypothetical protein